MLGEDGLPIDVVGPWAKEKHERLRQYIDITREVRRKFVSGPGASYIDLYSGAGRARVRDTAKTIDGSPVVAVKAAIASGVPFSDVVIADEAEELCRAAAERVKRLGITPRVEVGKAEDVILRIVKQLNPHGLHFTFLDPFSLQALPFSIFEALARLKRMDVLVHVSAQDLQRNLLSYTSPGDTRLDCFAPGWRDSVDTKRPQAAMRAAILEHWASKMEALGLPPSRHTELISGDERNQRLYWLMLVARHDLARQLWGKICSPMRQRDLFEG